MVSFISHCEISGTFPSSSILKEHNVSKIGSLSVVIIKIGELLLQLGQLPRGNLKHWINWFMLFLNTCDHHLNCNPYFLLTHNLFQNVSASLSHRQVYTLLQKLLCCHLSMSHVNVLLFLISSKYLNVHKITDSTALHPVNLVFLCANIFV
jgi:hypothetical protein